MEHLPVGLIVIGSVAVTAGPLLPWINRTSGLQLKNMPVPPVGFSILGGILLGLLLVRKGHRRVASSNTMFSVAYLTLGILASTLAYREYEEVEDRNRAIADFLEGMLGPTAPDPPGIGLWMILAGGLLIALGATITLITSRQR